MSNWTEDDYMDPAEERAEEEANLMARLEAHADTAYETLPELIVHLSEFLAHPGNLDSYVTGFSRQTAAELIEKLRTIEAERDRLAALVTEREQQICNLIGLAV